MSHSVSFNEYIYHFDIKNKTQLENETNSGIKLVQNENKLMLRITINCIFLIFSNCYNRDLITNIYGKQIMCNCEHDYQYHFFQMA